MTLQTGWRFLLGWRTYQSLKAPPSAPHRTYPGSQHPTSSDVFPNPVREPTLSLRQRPAGDASPIAGRPSIPIRLRTCSGVMGRPMGRPHERKICPASTSIRSP
ncbi:hypothetical protein KC19_VG087500 [Ceratodon purpureus]|uniref:Uncharacterized protein n=1 Tax=Ceratodon purpureus TaxID=3225 RepID=A0A8T0HNG5_CERPU|nr:hypothetical protein KC19_VG087500 [Ceratodon purpureus]